MIFDLDKMRDKINNSIFCYAKCGGEGLTDKQECQCYVNKVKKVECQAYRDKQEFLSYFGGLSHTEAVTKRKEILESMSDELKQSQWFKNNVER